MPAHPTDSNGPLALFVGSAAAFNVARVCADIGAMASGRIQVVTTRDGLETDTASLDIVRLDTAPTVAGELRALSAYLDTHDPRALVQVTRPPIHGTIVGTLAARHGVPFVYRYSGDRFYEYRVARGRERAVAFGLGAVLGRVPIRLADHHLALGPTGKRRLIARGVDTDSITVLPPAVDPGRFRGVEPAAVDVPAGRDVILFVGRLSHLKGRETLERTIPSVLTRRADVQFVLVGPNTPAIDVPARYSDHVTAVGAVPPASIPGYMRLADALVLPSLTEGVPRVLLESLAAETPVVARDVGDVASVTENTFETDGELVDLLCSLDALPLDSVTRFTRETLRSRYRAFFSRVGR